MRRDDIRPLLVPERTLQHRGLYVSVAGDIEGGSHSLTELDFFALAKEAGVPPPGSPSKLMARSISNH